MQTLSVSSAPFLVVGRIGLASLFILGGLNKALNYSATLEQMENVGLSPAAIMLPIVIVLEFCGGIVIAYGKRMVVLASCLLTGALVYLAGVSLERNSP